MKLGTKLKWLLLLLGGICGSIWLVATGKFSDARELIASVFDRSSGRNLGGDKERSLRDSETQRRTADTTSRVQGSIDRSSSGVGEVQERLDRSSELVSESDKHIKRIQRLMGQVEEGK